MPFCVAVWATDSVTALYGETITIPCSDVAPPQEELLFIKWKYVSTH